MERPLKMSECLTRTVEGLGKVEVSVEYRDVPVENPLGLPQEYERADEIYTLKVTDEGGGENTAQFSGEALFDIVDLYQRLQPRKHGQLQGGL